MDILILTDSPKGEADPDKSVIHFQMVPKRQFTSLGLCKGKVEGLSETLLCLLSVSWLSFMGLIASSAANSLFFWKKQCK